jgi:hypothetical protein
MTPTPEPAGTKQPRPGPPPTVIASMILILIRAAILGLAVVGALSVFFDPLYAPGGVGGGLAFAIVIVLLTLTIGWIRVAIALLQRRRWASDTALVVDIVTVLLGILLTALTKGSNLVSLCFVVFGGVSLILLFLRSSAEWFDDETA